MIIQNDTELNIFQLHYLLGEYLRHVHPNDNGETVYPIWTNRDGITVRKTEDGFLVTREEY